MRTHASGSSELKETGPHPGEKVSETENAFKEWVKKLDYFLANTIIGIAPRKKFIHFLNLKSSVVWKLLFFNPQGIKKQSIYTSSHIPIIYY